MREVGGGAGRRPRQDWAFRPAREGLEGRALLAASLVPIAGLSVPSQQGYVVALNGSGTADAQTFTATSSNPDVAVTVAQGPFLTLDVSYTDPANAANSFSGALTFQLFQNVTPNTATRISQFAAAGGFNGTQLSRIVKDFSGTGGAGDVVVQGGPLGASGGGTNPTELKQPLVFLQPGTLAIANAGANTDGQTFFITTGPQPLLEPGALPGSAGYTIFGQLVAGSDVLAEIAQVPVQVNTSSGEDSSPVNPVTITDATVTTANPNGALVVDTTQAKPGESATVSVTATDAADHSTATQSFAVTVGAYTGPADPLINYRPFASAATASTNPGHPTTVTLAGQSGYPDASHPATLSYTLVSQPAHGTVSQFNAAAGTFVYTPAAGYHGTDTFQYEVQSTGPQSTPATLASNPATVSVTVNAPAGLPSVVGADFNGDGVSDLAVFRPKSAQWILRPSGTGATQVVQFGDPSQADAPVPGDYDGVGYSELAVFRPATDQWLIRSPGGLRVVQFGDPKQGDVPVPGDYDGDGKTDLAVFRPATDQWIIRLSGTGKTVVVQFGDPSQGDTPVPGDYDGTGKTELAVFRARTDQWIIQNPAAGVRVVQFGDPAHGDVAAPGAYDGTGKTDLAVFRPATSQWLIQGPGGVSTVQFGDPASRDVPVESPYQTRLTLEARSVTAASVVRADALTPATVAAPAAWLTPPDDLTTELRRPRG